MTICHPTTAIWTPPDGADAATVELATALAWTQLQALMGYSLAICPIDVRPCRRSCTQPVYKVSPANGFEPHLSGGAWVNCSCDGDDCSCGGAASVILPGPVGRIDSVTIDGVALPDTAYRVDNGALLVRQDGDSWPTCQDMSLPADSAGTWTVRYFRGDAPTELDDWAAGILAAEFYKGMTGDRKCRLPAATTQVVRNGVTLDLRNNLFLDGTTGLREVDQLISIRNPHQLKQPTVVGSPDARRGRIPTWVR